MAQLREAFGDRLYVELLRHGLENEAATEPALLAIAKHADLPIVATNDAYFTTPGHVRGARCAAVHFAGPHLADTNRRRLTPEHSFKSGAEMRACSPTFPTPSPTPG